MPRSSNGRPWVREHLWIAHHTAWLVAALEVAIMWSRGDRETLGVHHVLHAYLSLGFMELPFMLLVGTLTGGILWAMSARADHEPDLSVPHIARLCLQPNADLFARWLLIPPALVAFTGTTAWSMVYFAVHHRNTNLAAITHAVVITVVALAILLALWLSMPPMSRWWRARKRFTRPIFLIVPYAGTAILAGLWWVSRNSYVVRALDPVRLCLPLVVAGTYVAVGALVHVHRPSHRQGWAARTGAALLLATVGLWWAHGHYGTVNRATAWITRTAPWFPWALQRYQRAFDRDEDGYASGFGGRDCNDHNPKIHPGAVDRPGDGVDSDCFDGDGFNTHVLPLRKPNYTVAENPRRAKRPNVLLFTIDALRSDHLGAYGHTRPTSPYIDRFARTALTFPKATAPSTRSVRAIPALMTGRYPSFIEYGPESVYPTLKEENVTWPELLKAEGYDTSVVMGTDFFQRVKGFFQGFDWIVQDYRYRPPRDVAVNVALERLKHIVHRGRPWFLWVHQFNVHAPYLWDGTPSKFGPDLRDHYDTEITFADRQFQRLLATLLKYGLQKNTIVVLASDHGEGFGEHNNIGHCTTLYQEELRATLMMRLPGSKPRALDHPVSLVDVLPTVLHAARVPPDRLPYMHGRSLLSPAAPVRPVLAEILPDGSFPFDHKAIIQGDHKLIWDLTHDTHQYFHLPTDPDEQRDLAEQRPEKASSLLKRLKSWAGSAKLGVPPPPPAVVEQLPKRFTHPVHETYSGLFEFVGLNVSDTEVRVGGTITFDFYYRVLGRTDKNLFIYGDLVGSDDYRYRHFHVHHFPVDGRFPTYLWEPGQIIRDRISIVVPGRFPAPKHLTLRYALLDEKNRPVVTATRKRTMDLVSLHITR